MYKLEKREKSSTVTVVGIEEVVKGRTVFYRPVIYNVGESVVRLTASDSVRLSLEEAYDLKKELEMDLAGDEYSDVTAAFYGNLITPVKHGENRLDRPFEEAEDLYVFTYVGDCSFECYECSMVPTEILKWVSNAFMTFLNDEEKKILEWLLERKRRAELFLSPEERDELLQFSGSANSVAEVICGEHVEKLLKSPELIFDPYENPGTICGLPECLSERPVLE